MAKRSSGAGSFPRAFKLAAGDLDQVVAIAGLLAGATRLRILVLLGERGETHVTSICKALRLYQSAASHDLAIFLAAGAVSVQQRYGRHFYSLANVRIADGVMEFKGDMMIDPNPLDYAPPPRRTPTQMAERIIVLCGLGLVILGLLGIYLARLVRWTAQ